jgi:hypothetical protein
VGTGPCRPEVITWRELSGWFKRKGEVRDKFHSAQLYQIGMTRFYEDENMHEYSLTQEANRVQGHASISIDLLGMELMFVVFESSEINLYEVIRGMNRSTSLNTRENSKLTYKSTLFGIGDCLRLNPQIKRKFTLRE